MSKIGRPSEGQVVEFRLPPQVVKRLDIQAALLSMSRAQLMRMFIIRCLSEME
jgi:predicted DNA-binding protein